MVFFRKRLLTYIIRYCPQFPLPLRRRKIGTRPFELIFIRKITIFNLLKKEKQFQIKMLYDKTKPATKKNIIDFLKSINIEVNTNNKARGNQGIYLKNRIDISKKLKEEKAVEVLVHEFAHHIHSQIDKEFIKNNGSLEILFDCSNSNENILNFAFKNYDPNIEIIKNELINVTHLIDKNSRLQILSDAKEELSNKIKKLQKAIKQDYPEFFRSKKFIAFEKYIKNSEAKYFVKYDIVKIIEGFFFKKERILNIKNLEMDFPNMPKAFQLYLQLCSLQRKQNKLTRRINKLNKYYEKSSELFARFVQAYFIAPETIKTIAPTTTKRFLKLLKKGYYRELKDLFEIFAPNSLNEFVN